MTTKNKSILTSLVFYVLTYGIYRFYMYATDRSRTTDDTPIIIFSGVLLIVAICVVGAMKRYYGVMQKNRSLKGEQLEAEIIAFGSLTKGQNKIITVNISGTKEEVEILKNGEILQVDKSRFNAPIRVGDYVNFNYNDNSGLVDKTLQCEIKNVDTYDHIVGICALSLD